MTVCHHLRTTLTQRLVICTVLVGLALISSPNDAWSQSVKGWNLRAFGGYGATSGSDLQSIADDTNQRLRTIAQSVGMAVTDELEMSDRGPEYGAEVLFGFTDRVGVYAGVDLIPRRTATRGRMAFGSIASSELSWDSTFRSVPVRAGMFYQRPIVSRLDLTVKGGIDLVLAKMTYTTRESNISPRLTDFSSNSGSGTRHGLGYEGGASVAYRVNTRASFFVEGTVRRATLDKWRFANTSTDSAGRRTVLDATLWYVERLEPGTAQYLATVELDVNQPSGANLRNVRSCRVGISGFVARSGIQIRF